MLAIVLLCIYRFPMEMHMVHINNKYMNHEEKDLNHDYLANKNGIAVLGFLFNVSGTKVNIVTFQEILSSDSTI